MRYKPKYQPKGPFTMLTELGVSFPVHGKNIPDLIANIEARAETMRDPADKERAYQTAEHYRRVG